MDWSKRLQKDDYYINKEGMHELLKNDYYINKERMNELLVSSQQPEYMSMKIFA